MISCQTQRAQHQQFEGGIGAVESIAKRLEPLQLIEQCLYLLVFEFSIETEFASLIKDVRPAREFREHHSAIVADRCWVDMFISFNVALNPGHVQPRLVRKGAAAD